MHTSCVLVCLVAAWAATVHAVKGPVLAPTEPQDEVPRGAPNMMEAGYQGENLVPPKQRVQSLGTFVPQGRYEEYEVAPVAAIAAPVPIPVVQPVQPVQGQAVPVAAPNQPATAVPVAQPAVPNALPADPVVSHGVVLGVPVAQLQTAPVASAPVVPPKAAAAEAAPEVLKPPAETKEMSPVPQPSNTNSLGAAPQPVPTSVSSAPLTMMEVPGRVAPPVPSVDLAMGQPNVAVKQAFSTGNKAVPLPTVDQMIPAPVVQPPPQFTKPQVLQQELTDSAEVEPPVSYAGAGSAVVETESYAPELPPGVSAPSPIVAPQSQELTAPAPNISDPVIVSTTLSRGYFKNILEVRYINLDKHTERRQFQEDQLTDLGIPFARKRGIQIETLGQAIADPVLRNIIHDIQRFNHPGLDWADPTYELSGKSKFVLSVALSHLSLYESIARDHVLQGNKYVLVVEDDFVLPQNFRQVFDEVMPYAPEDWEVIRLGCWGLQRKADQVNDYFFRATQPFWDPSVGTNAMFYGGAHAVLLRMDRLEGLIDKLEHTPNMRDMDDMLTDFPRIKSYVLDQQINLAPVLSFANMVEQSHPKRPDEDHPRYFVQANSIL